MYYLMKLRYGIVGYKVFQLEGNCLSILNEARSYPKKRGSSLLEDMGILRSMSLTNGYEGLPFKDRLGVDCFVVRRESTILVCFVSKEIKDNEKFYNVCLSLLSECE